MNDAAKQTGAGKQPPWTDFQNLCVSFVRSAKGNVAVDYIQPIEASGNDHVIDLEKNVALTSSKKKRKLSDDVKYERAHSKKHMPDLWKEKYFESITNNDEKLSSAKIKKIELESYHILLQSIILEKRLELSETEILGLRSAISSNLTKIPSYLSEIAVEKVFVTNTNELNEEAGSSTEQNNEQQSKKS